VTDTTNAEQGGTQPGVVSADATSATPQAPAQSAAFVYALGRIEPRFPSIGLEKEFAQASGRADTAGLTDRQTARAVLQEQRYIARQLCWVFSVEGLETYLLAPRAPQDLDLLVETLRPAPRPTDIDVVIGVPGPIAPPELCGGLVLPIVVFDQLYSFDVDSLIRDMPRPDTMTADQFQPVAEEVLSRVMQLADNAGATDEHRALNYCSVRYPAIYAQTAEMYARNFSLTSVGVRTSRLSGVRNIVDVVCSYTHRETDVTEQYFIRVDVTEEFPFLVTRLSPYFER
jgi:PatG C-terminal